MTKNQPPRNSNSNDTSFAYKTKVDRVAMVQGRIVSCICSVSHSMQAPINFETPIAYICCKRYLLDSKGECVINEKKFERTQISRCVHRNQMKFRIADPTAQKKKWDPPFSKWDPQEISSGSLCLKRMIHSIIQNQKLQRLKQPQQPKQTNQC